MLEQAAEVVISLRELLTWAPCIGKAGPVEASARPTETPQACDTVADPHRNPTDERHGSLCPSWPYEA